MELNGHYVAKRGRAGTPDAGNWIALVPGIEVTDTEGADEFLARQAREIEGQTLQ